MTTEIKTKNAEVWNVTNDDYHADSANSVSHSELDLYRENPELYFARLIRGTIPRERTKALDFGQVFHDIVLGPDHDIDHENFNYWTFGIWEPCPGLRGLEDKPVREFESDSGSRYWFFGDEVYRQSDHWGTCGTCYWALKDDAGGSERRFGKINYTDLLHLKRPGEKGKSFTPIPADVLSSSGSKAGKAWKAFELKHKNDVLLKEQEFEPLAAMLRQIKEHEAARRCLRGGQGFFERAIRWEDPETGLTLRCKPDRLTKFIVDLKSARSSHPKTFAGDAQRLGYPRQAAFYQDGVEALTGERRPFVFVVVDKGPIFRVETYRMKDEWVEQGRQQNREALRRLAEQRSKGEYRSWTHGEIQDLDAPRWAKYDDEYGSC